MRNIIGLLLGFYFTVALTVFAAAAWSFSTEPRWQKAVCSDGGAPNWMPWAAWRAFAWPRTYFDDADKAPANDIPAWLLVKYDPGPGICT